MRDAILPEVAPLSEPMSKNKLCKKCTKAHLYRPEIDGLRAFAVVAVIINHFNEDILPGGYLGVDIFFVISGYVITSSLFQRHSNNFKDFITGFYERRVKRLVPALSAFVIIISVAICLFNPTSDLSLRTGAASLLGLSNLYLLKQSTDYFAQSTELNVFAHTWSLGVEEQFYALFPFLIWFSGFGRQTKNGSRNLFLLVAILSVFSLVGFLSLSNENRMAAYFLMPARFWEMATGCLIFIGCLKRQFFKLYLEKVPSLLVIALIVAVMYFPVSMATSATISVVSLSSILIASLKKESTAFKLFTNPKVVYTGLISYSLYLWHWGVLSISRWTIGVHWWSLPIQIILMLGLAIASYRFIETPLRNGNWFEKRWKTLVAGGGVPLAIASALFTLGEPLNSQLYLGEDTPTQKYPFMSGQKCGADSLSNMTSCYFVNARSNRTLWVIGDSHAASLYKASQTAASYANLNLKLYTAGGTPFPPIDHYLKSDKQKDLQRLSDFRVLENMLIENLSEGDVVLLSMRLPYHFGGTYYEYPSADFAFPDANGSQGSQDNYFRRWISSVEKLASQLNEKSARLIVQTPTPEWKREREKECGSAHKQWFNSLRYKECSIESAFFDDPIDGIYRHLFEAVNHLESASESIVLLDTYSIVCPYKICRFNDGNDDIYSDDDHIDYRWANEFIAPRLVELIDG